MAFLSDTTELTLSPLRLLAIGESGSGKTGSLVSLAEAGYIIHILDCDHKARDLLWSLTTDRPALRSRIDIEVVQEKLTFKGGKPVISGGPKAWQQAVDIIGEWGSAGWDRSHIIVIDSLTQLARYCGYLIGKLNSREDFIPIFNDFSAVFNKLRPFLDLITAYNPNIEDDAGNPLPQLNCHVIVLAHVNLYEVRKKTGEKQKVGKVTIDETVVVDTKAYPRAIGQALSPDIPTYFNTMLWYKSSPNFPDKRMIYTVPDELAPVKCAIQGLPKALPIETGLAEVFGKYEGKPK